MTSSALPSRFSRFPLVAWVGGTCVALGLAALFCVTSPAVAQGWLVAFVFWSSIPIGSLVVLLIHRLVGGEWGEVFGPTLFSAASMTPLVMLAILPVVLNLPAVFPWAASPQSLPAGLNRLYLNEPFFLARAVLALGGWSILALMIAQERCTTLVAALGLAFYGLMISLVAIDWILSTEPRFVSSAFAAGIALQQILAAFAWAAFMGPETTGSRAAGDLGSLLIAALLGVVYIDLMSYIVAWYGDLPVQAEWYLRRMSGAWGWTIATAVILGAIIPFALLVKSDFRRNWKVLRVVGALILVGIWLHLAWLTAPTFASGWLTAAIVGLVVLAILSFGLAKSLSSRIPTGNLSDDG